MVILDCLSQEVLPYPFSQLVRKLRGLRRGIQKAKEKGPAYRTVPVTGRSSGPVAGETSLGVPEARLHSMRSNNASYN